MVSAVIILNNGHTRHSPGGVFGGRTEYLECLRLQRALYEEIKCLAPSAEIRLCEGAAAIRESSPEDMLFVLHKGTSLKNAPRRGADIFVGETASARIQYEAYRILCALCPPGGLRYRGVHTVTKKSPFGIFRALRTGRAYIISAGYIDNAGDNAAFDRSLSRIAHNTAKEIVKIYKERKNEDNG